MGPMHNHSQILGLHRLTVSHTEYQPSSQALLPPYLFHPGTSHSAVLTKRAPRFFEAHLHAKTFRDQFHPPLSLTATMDWICSSFFTLKTCWYSFPPALFVLASSVKSVFCPTLISLGQNQRMTLL